MSIGNNTLIIVCSANAVAAAPCPAGTGPTVTEAYILSNTAAQYIEPSAAPFDPATAVSFWGIAMSAVLLCWFTAWAAKQIIKAVY